DRLGSQTLVPCHGPFPQCGQKESAHDGTTDHTKVEDGIDIVNMLIPVRLPVICSERGGLSNPAGMGAFMISLSRGQR
ncbi:hypothetical protein A2U01_0088694, partial [Trifolium medium]|nr:hypothetical protein [Trifolium medium]